MYQISDEVRRLTNKEKQQYSEQGYVKNLPVFSHDGALELQGLFKELSSSCLLYTSPSPRDRIRSRMPSSA